MQAIKVAKAAAKAVKDGKYRTWEPSSSYMMLVCSPVPVPVPVPVSVNANVSVSAPVSVCVSVCLCVCVCVCVTMYAYVQYTMFSLSHPRCSELQQGCNKAAVMLQQG